MKAVVVQRTGGPEVLAIAAIAPPRPGPGRYVVRVRAAGVNPIDCKLRAGAMGPLRAAFPWTPGCEFAGEVVERGPGTERFAVGDPVLGVLDPKAGGATAELVAADETALARKPVSMTFEEAAGLPVAGLTAWQGLVKLGHLRAGQRVLVNGAAGGVGHVAVQLAKLAGAVVTAVAGPRNAGFVRELGATDVVDYATEDFARARSRYDLVFDAVAARSFWDVWRAIKPGGSYVTTLPGGAVVTGILFAALLRRRARFVLLKPLADDLDALRVRADEHGLRIAVQRVFSLGEIAAAHAASEAGHVRGKLIVTL